MNKAEAREYRAAVLRHNVADARDGWAIWAKLAARKRTMLELLRATAEAIRNPNHRELTRDERFFVSTLLTEVAEGVDVRKGLRITSQKIGHRPAKTLYRLSVGYEVWNRVDEGDDPPVAIAAVAEITGRTKGQVRKDWQLAQSKDWLREQPGGRK